MIPLRLEERDHPDFDEPIVEVWRENEFVGYVFWDDDVAVVQVYPDAGGEPFDLDSNDLIRVLDVAQRIVTPDGLVDEAELDFVAERGAEGEGGWEEEDHRIVTLAEEWDGRATHRDADGEGFFALTDAVGLLARCESLDVAVVEVEGLEWDGAVVTSSPDHHLVIEAEPGAAWEAFRPQANAAVATRLRSWPDGPDFLVSFVVRLPDGSTRVL